MGIPCTTGQVLEDESCSCGIWGACVWKYEICLQKHLKLLVWAAGSDTAEGHTRLTLIGSTSYQTRRHIVSVEVIRVKKKKKVCRWRNLVIFFWTWLLHTSLHNSFNKTNLLVHGCVIHRCSWWGRGPSGRGCKRTRKKGPFKVPVST